MTYNERLQSDGQDNTNNDTQGDFTPSEFANGAGDTPTAASPDAAATIAPTDHPNGGPGQRLRPLDLAEVFALDIKPRGMVLEPIIPQKGLVMLYAARGTGNTHAALGIAYAVATGSSSSQPHGHEPVAKAPVRASQERDA